MFFKELTDRGRQNPAREKIKCSVERVSENCARRTGSEPRGDAEQGVKGEKSTHPAG
jgi:hypothetical protein